MCGFHTVCIFIAVIGKRFTGLKDIIVEADLLGSLTADKVVSGKHYKYGMRVLKYIYETLQRIKIDKFEDWLRQKQKMRQYDAFIESKEFETLCNNTSWDILESVKLKFNEMFLLIQEFDEILRDKECNPLSAYLMSFIDMVQILLEFTKSVSDEETGNYI